jgi:hypothetical protein
MKLNLQEPNLSGHFCTSIGKFSKFMGHAALIVNLNTPMKKAMERKNDKDAQRVNGKID